MQMTRRPRRLLYRGAIYKRAYEKSQMGDFSIDEVVLHSKLMPYGIMESGDAYCPRGGWHPMWADIRGRKWAEVDPPDAMRQQLPAGEQYFLRIDNKPDWRWEWGEGVDDQSVLNTYLRRK